MLKFKGYCAEHGIKQSEIAELLGITTVEEEPETETTDNTEEEEN